MLKRPLSYCEQVQRLKEHNMIVPDEDFAQSVLEKINYYRFTGYALQFRENVNSSDYVDGTTFDNVYKLYCFDEALRQIFRKYIEQAEIYYRTVISHEFSMLKCVNFPHNQHYNSDSYYDKRGFEEIKERFQREKIYYKDSLIVKHHKRKYDGYMPLWVMVEMMSMSDVSKLYSCMYSSDQRKIADVIKTGPTKLKNHLHCISVLRNKCAHAARLYNTTFYPPAELGSNFLRNHPYIKNDTLFSYVLVLLKRIPNKDERINMITTIEELLKEYKENINLDCVGFPVEWKKILYNQAR